MLGSYLAWSGLGAKSSGLVHGIAGCAAWRQELLKLASLERPIGTLGVAWCGGMKDGIPS